MFTTLTERQGQLRSLIVNSNRVFEATAARDAELAETFRILPTLLDESRLTVERTTEFAQNANPLVTQLRPAARELSPTLRDLASPAPDLKAFFRDLDPLIDVSKKGLPGPLQARDHRVLRQRRRGDAGQPDAGRDHYADPLLPQELRDQIQEFIYGGQRGTVAPECKPQEPLGPRLTGTPGVYPHVEAAPER